jgi:alpha-tubulin suppressor-like RCC1 family protein
VEGIVTATGVSASSDFSCAVLSNGRVDCWGANESSQIGRYKSGPQVCKIKVAPPLKNKIPCSKVPVEVAGISTATHVAAGYGGGLYIGHACASLASGHVMCWGTGVLGNGEPAWYETSIPVEAKGIADATQVSVGDSVSCAALSSGQVECWGEDAQGQLGDGGEWSARPAEVLGLS